MPSPAILRALEEVKNSPTFIASPDLLDRTIWWADSDGLEKLILKPSDDDDPIVEAPVEWVGEVQASHFRLLPDGGFTAKFGGQLSAQKASARIGQPVYPTYAELWRPIPEAVARIQNSRKSPRATSIGNQLLVDGCLRVRHTLFKLNASESDCSADSESVKVHTSTTGTDTKTSQGGTTTSSETTKVETRCSEIEDTNPFSIRNWPCTSTDAKEQLQEIIDKGSFEVQPIPAYDVDDNLIAPQDYEAQLKDAIVRVKATISYQYLRKPKTDNFYADIQEIRVLRPPITTAAPCKRKLQEATDRAAKRARTPSK